MSPFAPHIAEELWSILGHQTTLAYEPWPKFDAALAEDETLEIPVQINGKLRAKIHVARGVSKENLENLARDEEKVAAMLNGKNIVKVVVVPDRLVNFVHK